MGNTSSLLNQFSVDWHLMVSLREVQAAVDFKSRDGVERFVNPREHKCIFTRRCVNLTLIDEHAPWAVLLRHHDDWARPL